MLGCLPVIVRVTKLVLRSLLDPEYESGAIVDGYPRTKTQVECLKLSIIG